VSRETVADIRSSIDELHRQGDVDFIKLVTTGIVDFAERRVKQAPQFTVDELTQVVAHAHGLGYKVASHCSGQEGIDINLAAGVDFIEHAYFIREDQIDQMIERGIAWTPTLAPVQAQGHHAECGWPDDVRRNIESILREHAARIAYAVSGGATVLVGTDAGSPGVEMGRGIHVELQRLATAGIPAEKLLRMATVGNARAVGAKDYSPTLEMGGPASFALYERCPWRDINNLDSLRHVFVSGRRVR
jgi:imidazolonepropionase-like amidohydrolase